MGFANIADALKKILIRGPNWVGDSVLAIPAMKAVRARFPEAEITLLVRPWVAGVFKEAPFIDRLWSEPRPAGIADWMRITRKIRKGRFDMALLFPNSFESAAMIFFGRVPQRIGYATDGRRLLLTNSLKPASGKRHQVYYYLDLAAAVSAAVDQPSISIEACPEEKMQAARLLAAEGIPSNRHYLVLNPGAAYGSAKRWGEDRFADAADTLATEMDLDVAIVGSEKERSIAESIQKLMRHRVAMLTGRTSLETLIGVISGASLVLTNDSGPMHVAAALGIPTVAVFGSTDHNVTSPWGARTRVVREPVECSPCMLRECPIDHPCMTRISADAVCRAAREVLNAR
jgi:lipopolysaccharide heptosyltransferase II